MRYEFEKLGRPPVMRFPERAVEPDPGQDWRGEHNWHVPRSHTGGGGFNMKSPKVNSRIAAQNARREKVAVLHGKGLTETDIAAECRVSQTCVRRDLAALGLK